MEIWQIFVAAGIPSSIFGLLIWYFQRKLAKSEESREKHQKDLESLVLMMLQSTRANTVLCKATAEAVRDGHCNGNMTSALKVVEQVADAEKDFLYKRGIKYLFE